MGKMLARAFAVIAIGCAACGDDPELTPIERSAAADGLFSVEGDATVVDLIEATLSGDFTVEQNEDLFVVIHAAASAANAAAAARAGGCISSTQTALDATHPTYPVVTHALSDCTINGHTLAGTVTSTWFAVDGIQISHESSELTIDGRAATVTLDVELYPGMTVESRRRRLSLRTTDVLGDQVGIEGTWLASYDPATDCGSRDGTAMALVGPRSLARADAGLTWCGGGRAGVIGTGEAAAILSAGTIEITGRGSAAPVVLEILGEDRFRVVRPDGSSASASVSDVL